MAAEQRVVELVVDASGAVAGTRLSATAYEHFGARAEAAIARAQAAADRQFTKFQAKGARSVDAVAASYDTLRAKMDPVFHAQLRAEREMTQSLAVVNRAVMLGVTTQEQATRDIIRLKRMQVEAINQVRDAQMLADRTMTGANDNFPMGADARYRRQNLSYQVFDIGQSAALGMPLGMVAMQQVPQILQLYAGQGGFNAALKDTAALLSTVARVLAPVAVAATAVYGAWQLLASYSVDAAFKISAATRELASSAMSWQSLEGQVEQLSQVQKSYNDLITDTARVHTDATGTIIANTEREFNAKKALLEIELLRQRASIDVQKADMAAEERRLRRDIGAGDPGGWSPFDNTNPLSSTRMDLEARGFADPRIGSVPFVQIPEEISGWRRLMADLEKNPVAMKLREMQANLDLNILSVEKLAKGLHQVFDPTAGGVINDDGTPNEFVVNNPAIPTGNPRRSLMEDPAFAMSANRLRDLREEVALFGLSGGAAARKRFELEALNAATEKGIQLSDEQRIALKKDADAYGELTDQLSRMRLVQDAQFEIDQMGRSDREARVASRLRSMDLPVDLASQQAEMLRSIEIMQDMRDAWQEVGDTGRSAIDQMTDGLADGFKDAEDILKNVFGDINKEFLKLAISNPLKNAIYDDENQTLVDLGGVKGFFSALTGGKMEMDPAMRNVGSMQVSAASVVVNGGVSGFSPAGGISRMQNPANANDPFAAVMTGSDGTGANGGARAAWDFWKSKGLADHQVAGILGNIKAESAFNPLAVGDGGNAFGLYQHNDRRNNLFAAIGGKGNLSDSMAQHEFAYRELMGPENRAWQALLASRDTRSATAAFAGFERPSGFSWANPEGAHNFAGRLEGADEALRNFGGTVGATTQGLGVLGNGFGQVGNALSQIGIGGGKGSGGLFSDLLGNLGGIFGGVSPTSSLWAPNTTYSNFLAGIPGFARGTNGAPAGWKWVGEEGPELMKMRGGEVIRPHAQSRDMAANARPTVIKQTIFNGTPPGYQPEVEYEEDEYGNEKAYISFSKLAAREAGRKGSPLNRQLGSMGARQPRRKM